MPLPLLLIGTADDGPDALPTEPGTLADAETIYAPYRYEAFALAGTEAAITLAEPPWGPDVRAFTLLAGGRAVPYPLYAPAVSGAVLSFGPTGEPVNALIRYRPAPREGDLLPALAICLERGVAPRALRAPGRRACVRVGGITLAGRWSGTRYNGITAHVAGDTLTLTLPATFDTQTRVYAIGALGDLAQAIQSDCDRGVFPVGAECPDPTVRGLPAGDYTLTGGTDGAMTSEGLAGLLAALDLTGVEAVLFAGGADPTLLSGIQAALDANPDYPTLAFCGSPLAASGTATAEYAADLGALPIADPRVFYVPGWTDWEAPDGPGLRISLAAVFAAQWMGASGPPTHAPAGVDVLLPAWTPAELQALAGRCVLYTRFIQTGVAPWWSGPTNGEDPTVTALRQQVAARLDAALQPYLGHPEPRQGQLEQSLTDALQDLPVRDLTLSAEIVGTTAVVRVQLVRYGELRAISLTLTTRRR